MERLEDKEFSGEFYTRLTDFFARLRLRGLSVNQVQEVRVFELLSRLAAAGRHFQSAGELSNHIVPILAGNAEQQRLCQDVLLETYGAEVSPIESQSPTPDISLGDRNLVHQLLAQLTRVRTITILVVGALMIWGSLVIYQSWPDEKGPSGGTPNIPDRVPNALVSMDWIYEISIKELEPPPQSWRNRTARWYYTEYDLKKWLAALGPWVVYAAVLGAMIWAVMAHLQRERARHNLADLPFSFKGDRPRFGDRHLLSGLQPLRRVAREHLHKFDAEASIDATARAGGRPIAKFEEQPIPVDFVTLVDRRSPRDHFAYFGEIFFNSLDAAGIRTEKYTFDTTPDILGQASTGRIDTAENVLNGLSDAIVLAFLTEDEIFDPLTGNARDWIGVFGDRNQTFLFVPESQADAGDIHDVLPPGVCVLPATPAGLRSMVSALTKSAGRRSRVNGRLHPLDRLFAELSEQPDLWNQATPLPEEETTELLAKLKRSAGPENMRWIGATSVYPELRWPMTLRLRDRLDGRHLRRAQLNSDLLRIVQLPWFRQGRMPDWLRIRMIEGLPANWAKRVREVLLNAIGIDGGRNTAPLNVARDTQAATQDLVKTDHIMLRYLFAGQQLPKGAFSLPKDMEKKFRRRPVRNLLFAGTTGAFLAAGGSLVALSQLPINQCDLWGASVYAPDRIGPGWRGELIKHGGFLERVIQSCETAKTNAPNNIRFQYQYVRALSSRNELTEEQQAKVIRRLVELGNRRYAPAINSLGYHHSNETSLDFTRDIKVAAEYFLEAYQAGSLEALSNLAAAYKLLASQDESYFSRRREALEKHYDSGGVLLGEYAWFLKYGGGPYNPNLQKHLEVINAGHRRGDGSSSMFLGSYYENVNMFCDETEDCKLDYESARSYYRDAIKRSADPYAGYRLAVHFFRGLDVKPNLNEAFYWAVFAARQEEDQAIGLLLEILALSTPEQREKWGVDSAKIISKMRNIADTSTKHGADDKPTYAQYYLGRYFESAGDFDQALHYYRLAEQNGHSEASDGVERLE